MEGTCIGFEARFFVQPYRFWQVYRNGSPLLLEIYWFRIKSIIIPLKYSQATCIKRLMPARDDDNSRTLVGVILKRYKGGRGRLMELASANTRFHFK